MVKGIILTFLLGLFVSTYADNLENYKEVSDKFFNEQIQMLSKGSLAQKIAAIEKLKKAKTRRALRPLILVLRGVSLNGGEPTKDLTIPLKGGENTEDKFVNLELGEHNDPALKFLASQAIAELYHEAGMKPMVDVFKQMEAKIKEDDKIFSYTNKFEQVNFVNAAAEILRSIGTLIDNLENLEEGKNEVLKANRIAIELGLETLKSALSHKHYYIRAGAADGLKNAHRKESLEILDAAVANEKDEYVKAAILSAIVILQPQNIQRMLELVQLLKSESPLVRMRTSQGLGETGVFVAETYLRQALQYEDSFAVRQQLKEDIIKITSYRLPTAPTSAFGSEEVPKDTRKQTK